MASVRYQNPLFNPELCKHSTTLVHGLAPKIRPLQPTHRFSWRVPPWNFKYNVFPMLNRWCSDRQRSPLTAADSSSSSPFLTIPSHTLRRTAISCYTQQPTLSTSRAQKKTKETTKGQAQIKPLRSYFERYVEHTRLFRSCTNAEAKTVK